MKIIRTAVVLFLVLFFSQSCEDDNNNNPVSLTGKWLNSSDYSQYITFVDSTNALINGHDFLYSIHSDSISFEYSGELFIYCAPTSHKYQLDLEEQTLSIENMDKLCIPSSHPGITIYSKNIQPNHFIGDWITTDLQDTFCFVSNERMEKPRGYMSLWYEYSSTADSLTIQYSGPAKIYILPVTNKYLFKQDTLIIDFRKDYYPDIKGGLKKFLKRKE